MSIIVKGMQAPKNCGDCRFNIDESDTGIGVCVSCIVREEYHVKSGSIPADCPIQDIPPHGRLIDADKFNEFIEKNCTDSLVDLWKELVHRQPTVIEAEE